MPTQRRFSTRVATDIPIAWCTVGGDGLAGAAAGGTCVDISSTGIGFLTDMGAEPRDAILVHLEHDLLAAGLAVPGRIVRVNRAPGGYRLGAAWESLETAQRAALGRFVIALMSARAA